MSETTQSDTWENFTIRVPRGVTREIDDIVEKTKGGPAEVSRSSLVRYWIERGIKEAKRSRT